MKMQLLHVLALAVAVTAGGPAVDSDSSSGLQDQPRYLFEPRGIQRAEARADHLNAAVMQAGAGMGSSVQGIRRHALLARQANNIDHEDDDDDEDSADIIPPLQERANGKDKEGAKATGAGNGGDKKAKATGAGGGGKKAKATGAAAAAKATGGPGASAGKGKGEKAPGANGVGKAKGQATGQA